MPVIKSAKKKLKQDIRREQENKKIRNLLKDLVKRATKSKKDKQIRDAVKTADKAVKKHIIHKNKAARIKSKLYALIKTEKTEVKASPKKATLKKTS